MIQGDDVVNLLSGNQVKKRLPDFLKNPKDNFRTSWPETQVVQMTFTRRHVFTIAGSSEKPDPLMTLVFCVIMI